MLKIANRSELENRNRKKLNLEPDFAHIPKRKKYEFFFLTYLWYQVMNIHESN